MKPIAIDNRHSLVNAALAAAASVLVLWPVAGAAQGERYGTSEEAVKALTAAAANKDTNAMEVILGPSVRELISADPVQASNGLANFSRRFSEKVEPLRTTDSKIVLQLGLDAWPFPIPLVEAEGKWYFDTDAGREEILNRRIGRNELDVIRVCHAYVRAQRDYATEDHTGSQVLEVRATDAQHRRPA